MPARKFGERVTIAVHREQEISFERRHQTQCVLDFVIEFGATAMIHLRLSPI